MSMVGGGSGTRNREPFEHKRSGRFRHVVLACCFAVFSPALGMCHESASCSAVPPAGCPAKFVTALAADASGGVWVGTEGQGVFHLPADGGAWRQFTVKEGLGDDNAYALCVDRLGRVWAGHVNHGVSVFNGVEWRNFDVPHGPIGERVFALACSPLDGDVWIATSAGLTRYREKSGRWQPYTMAHGLPENQCSALAFTATGNLVVGTQSHGLALASAREDYRYWTRVAAPERFGPGGVSPWRLEPEGDGLAGNCVNALLMGSDGTVWAATDSGLSWSRSGGMGWTFIRGRDFNGKVRGLLGGAPKGWKAADKQTLGALLGEDHVTALAESADGLILAGHWRCGFSVFNPALGKLVFQDPKAGYVTAFLRLADGSFWRGGYGEGLAPARFDIPAALRRTQASASAAIVPAGASAVPSASTPPPFPAPAGAPSLEELNALLAELGAVPPASGSARPVFELADDWRTRGDWLGRYGTHWCCICSICAPLNSYWGGWPVTDTQRTEFDYALGPNSDEGDGIRHWVHWMYTKEPRSLELPPVYMHSRVVKKLTTWDVTRREAENDDHGEVYSVTRDGPHMYYRLVVPEGAFCLSLYFINPNGHDGTARHRDYWVALRPLTVPFIRGNDRAPVGVDSGPVLARRRVVNFWGGVYVRFFVSGPRVLCIEVNRNGSFNTMLSGLMLDRFEAKPPPYFGTVAQWQAQQAKVAARNAEEVRAWAAGGAERAKRFRPGSSAPEAAERLWNELELARQWNPAWWAANSDRFHQPLLRGYMAGEVGWKDGRTEERKKEEEKTGKRKDGKNRSAVERTSNPAAERAALCRYWLRFFPQWEDHLRGRGEKPARDIEKALRWDGREDSRWCGHEIIEKYLRPPKESAASLVAPVAEVPQGRP